MPRIVNLDINTLQINAIIKFETRSKMLAPTDKGIPNFKNKKIQEIYRLRNICSFGCLKNAQISDDYPGISSLDVHGTGDLKQQTTISFIKENTEEEKKKIG